MGIYLDDLIAEKSLYFLMQPTEAINKKLEELKKTAQERCNRFKAYSMVQANEKKEETALAPITEEIFLLKKVKNMLGHVRMFFNNKKRSGGSLCPPEETQQEIMAKKQLLDYETTIFSSKQIEAILGREKIMKILGIDLSEYKKENKGKQRTIERETILEI